MSGAFIMRLVIEAREFAALSRKTQLELIGRFAGGRWRKSAESRESTAHGDALIDLAPIQAARLVERLPEDHRRFLQVFAQRGGRVRRDELLAAAKDSNPERVRDAIREIDASVHALLGADLAGEHLFLREQDCGEATVYRVSEPTTRSLRCFFPVL